MDWLVWKLPYRLPNVYLPVGTPVNFSTDPAVVDTITITVTDTGGDTETITLYETGPDTGVFANNDGGTRYALPLSDSAGASEDGTLNFTGGESITVDYHNGGEDTSGNSAFTPTLVVLSSFRAFEEGGRVIVEWRTAAEIGTVGFYLARLDPEIGRFVYGYDPRVVWIDDRYYVTWCNCYHGPTIGMGYTHDFRTFHQMENAFLIHNRNGVLFSRKINGKYLMLSRPSDR